MAVREQEIDLSLANRLHLNRIKMENERTVETAKMEQWKKAALKELEV